MRPAVPFVLAVAAIAPSVAAAGCGLGAGKATSSVTVTVTHGFGAEQIGSVTQRRVPGSETVMRLLERSFRVTTRYGGGFVESIDGLAGTSSRRDWFYYVNGVQAPTGAAGTAVHRGDRIWWDLHDWSATNSVPAVVGAFPEPFVHGFGGRRWPTTLACASDTGAACNKVAAELKALGIPSATQQIGSASGTDSIAVVVGTWRDIRGQFLGALIEHGPASSGIYARFVGPAGSALQLLDPAGHVVRTLGAGSGLVAATAQGSAAPTWLITGTDAAGVSAAASTLTPARLRNHFALAVRGNSDLPVPLKGAT